MVDPPALSDVDADSGPGPSNERSMTDPAVPSVDANNRPGPSIERQVERVCSSGVPEIKMEFQSFKEAHEYYTQYADSLGFGVRIRSSVYDKEKIVRRATLACSKSGKAPRHPRDSFYEMKFSARTDCQAHMRLRMTNQGKYMVVSFNGDHNHGLLDKSLMKFLPSKRRNNLTPVKQKWIKSEDQAGIGVTLAKPSSVAGGCNNTPFTEQDEMDILRRVRTLKLGHGDAEALHNYFRLMQAQSSGFFYLLDLDPLGRLKNVFWADLRSRIAYKFFGDAVTLDTTYLTNGYNVPFAPFIGVNHHGQPVVLGCCLLAEETTENYIWLFNSWLACMLGQAPKAIVMNHSKPIMEAVSIVFPNTQHRLCLWNIMQKIPLEFESDDFIKGEFKDAVYDSMTIEVFEEKWKKMNEKYNLNEDHWLTKMYRLRQLWVPAYVNDAFWANMSTTQWNESMKVLFDGHVNSRTSLKQFVSQYEMVLASKYEKEAKSDFNSSHKTAHLMTSFYMEEQLAQLYTNEIFKKCQEEFVGMMYCDVLHVDSATCTSTFEITEHVRLKLKDGSSKLIHKGFRVWFNKEEPSVRCICRMFESSGILCKHALSVMRNQGLDEIPQHYILDRWKKDNHRVYVQPQLPRLQDTDDPLQRSENVLKMCVGFAEVASMSSEKYKNVVNVLNEAFTALSIGSRPHEAQI